MAALLRHPIKNAAGEVNNNPTDAQTKIHNDALMQHWHNELAEFIESKLTGDPLTLVQNISTTDPERGSTTLMRLHAVYGHLATRDDNTDQEELLKKAVVGLHALMIHAATTWAIAPLIKVLEAYYLASVSLNTTGELHDKSMLLMVKMILEQCPDTRHTVAFPVDTFDTKYKTIPIILAEKRQHARRAPDRTSAGQENHFAALAITTPTPPGIASTPTQPRFANNTPSRSDDLQTCRQCGLSVKNINHHLFKEHYDALKPTTQGRLSAKYGNAGTTRASTSDGAGNILSLKTAPAAPPPLSMYETAQEYEAAGLQQFLWDGQVVNINAIR
ncbi:hypothetical protein T484DRAFT_1858113 [Baffinella frigidus]|nr:hypothetical protein T484DRAFT_1858113 [Cryptophyta sp. CCMP2293]